MPLPLLLLALAAVLPSSHAIRETELLEVDGGVFGRFLQFGFQQGGTLDLSLVTANPASVPGGAYLWAGVCLSSQLDAIMQMSQAALCSTNWNQLCWASAMLGNGNGTTTSNWTLSSVPVPQTDYYQFLVCSCTNYEIDLQASWHLVNPGGNELSSGYLPLLKLYPAMLSE